MRVVTRIIAGLLLVAALGVGAAVFIVANAPELPPRPPLPARDGPALGGAKVWGYQLQQLNPALINADIDLLVVDFSRDGTAQRVLTPDEVQRLRTRPDGRRRIVLSYLSIGEAETYRFYWKARWSLIPPLWLGRENPEWKGNYDVDYWRRGWQRLIVDPSPQPLSLWDRLMTAIFPWEKPYLDRVMEAGFDGVYLDKIDAFDTASSRRPSAKADMRKFVATISTYAKARKPGFLIVPQNGEALLADAAYRKVVDGIAKEDLFYGEKGDGVANKADEIAEMTDNLNRLKADGKPVFVVEYVADPEAQKRLLAEWARLGFVGLFAERSLSRPPALAGPAVAPAGDEGAAVVPAAAPGRAPTIQKDD